MENKERRNLKLTGNGIAAGGFYNYVKMTGEEIINGDLDCINIKLTGTVMFGEMLKQEPEN